MNSLNGLRKLQRTLGEHMFRGVAIDSIVVFRLLFGGIMVWEVYRYFSKGWIKRYWIDPPLNFHFEGFAWLQSWPGDGMYIHFWVLGIAASCIVAGFLYRLSTVIFFLGFTYVFLLEQARYLNHFYLVCLISFLMIFIPTHRAFSIDALINKKIRSNTIDGWCLWLLRFQLGIVYFYGGVAKINRDWLQGEPMRMWLAKRADYPWVGDFFTQDWCVYFFSYGGLLYDLLIVPLLLWRKTRVFAVLITLFFHLTNAYIFSIGIFPWFMLAATTIFFEPDWPRRLVGFLWHRKELRRQANEEVPIKTVRHIYPPLISWCIGIYVFLQLAVPLRHFLYPGNVSWTEEGHQFAWHMKLRSKRSKIRFIVRDAFTNEQWRVNPLDELPRWQARKMSRHPRMILQYAHYLAAQKRQEGYTHVQVRVKTQTSLNGRRAQPLIDPATDLAQVNLSVFPSRWILPLEEPLRPNQ